MKSSSPEDTQRSGPLGPPIRSEGSTPSGEQWKPYGPNPALEINSKGQLRTKPEPLPPPPNPYQYWTTPRKTP